jgi:hypothetical protein
MALKPVSAIVGRQIVQCEHVGHIRRVRGNHEQWQPRNKDIILLIQTLTRRSWVAGANI